MAAAVLLVDVSVAAQGAAAVALLSVCLSQAYKHRSSDLPTPVLYRDDRDGAVVPAALPSKATIPSAIDAATCAVGSRALAKLGVVCTLAACCIGVHHWAPSRLSQWTPYQLVAIAYGVFIYTGALFRCPAPYVSANVGVFRDSPLASVWFSAALLYATSFYIWGTGQLSLMLAQAVAAWVALVMAHVRVGHGTKSTVLAVIVLAIAVDLVRFYHPSDPVADPDKPAVDLGFVRALDLAIPGFLVASDMRFDRRTAAAPIVTASASSVRKQLGRSALSLLNLMFYHLALCSPAVRTWLGKLQTTGAAIVVIAGPLLTVLTARPPELLRAWWDYDESSIDETDGPVVLLRIYGADVKTVDASADA
ncbi:hypothetical protein Q5752_003040 [Cryptotrichosporon argae]